MFSMRLFQADHPNGTSMVDVIREMSRKPKPRYLECIPATFAQPTPCHTQLEERAKFAAILDGEWDAYDGGVRAANTEDKAVNQGHAEVVYTTWPPVLSIQDVQRSAEPLNSQYWSTVSAFDNVEAARTMGLANVQTTTAQGGGATQLGQWHSNQRKRAFHAFEKLATARLLAQETGEGDLLLRDIMDFTLAAAAQDAELEFAMSDAKPTDSANIAPPVQMPASDRATTPWEEWAPQATSTPRLSPASSGTLLSPEEDWVALSTLTPRPSCSYGQQKGGVME